MFLFNFLFLRVIMENALVYVSTGRLSGKNMSMFKLFDAFAKSLPQLLLQVYIQYHLPKEEFSALRVLAMSLLT